MTENTRSETSEQDTANTLLASFDRKITENPAVQARRREKRMRRNLRSLSGETDDKKKDGSEDKPIFRPFYD